MPVPFRISTSRCRPVPCSFRSRTPRVRHWRSLGAAVPTTDRPAIQLEIGIDGEAPADAGSWSKSFVRGERVCVLTQEELNRIVIDECNVRKSASVRLKVKLTMNTSVHWKLYSVADSAYVNCSLYTPVYPEQRHKAPMYWSP